MAQREFRQIYPQPGWVEHDPKEIWATQLATAQEALAKAGIERARHRLASASPTSARPPWCGTAAPASRSPTRSSGRTGAPRRSAPRCARAGSKRRFRAKTGLIIDPYFSGTKLKWMLDNVPRRARRGEARRARVRHRRRVADVAADRRHACTPPTSATHRARCCSNVHTNQWDDELLGAARRAARAAAAGASVEPRLRQRARRAARRGGADRRRRGRPAERAVRPGVLSRRAGEEHLRHRLLHADAHRRALPELDQRAHHDRAPRSSAAAGAPPQRPSSRSKAACSSPARWCSGCATGCTRSRAAARCSSSPKACPTAAA